MLLTTFSSWKRVRRMKILKMRRQTIKRIGKTSDCLSIRNYAERVESMFVIWGSKGFVEDLGKTHLECECPNCHNWVTMQGIKMGRKFTLFFIPLFTTSSEHFIACPICMWREEVSIPKMESYLVRGAGKVIEE